jgi:hypothetical protein
MANTLLDAVKDLRNDSLRDLVSAAAFTGETSVAATSPFLGSNYGYTSGGSYSGATNVIEKFSFTSDANATDVGDLTIGRYSSSGQSSATHGYTSGGASYSDPSAGIRNVIDKFTFSTDANATDVGDLTSARWRPTGQSSIPNGYGYASGSSLSIDKFPFSSDANATAAGDLTLNRELAAGQSSTTHGYTSGGYASSLIIDKFPFSTDANATDVGDLTVARGYGAGQSSSTHGYFSGGTVVHPDFDPVVQNIIEKFSFTSNGNATDVGDLTAVRYSSAGQSSTTHGYASGGGQPSGATNIIDKFPFSTDGNATDVGDLTQSKYFITGQQY